MERGFKEILYGLNNESPALLLDLFASSPAAFTFRHPKQTIESMIRSWDTNILKGKADPPALGEAFAERASRWKIIVDYYIGLKKRVGKRLIFVSMDLLEREPGLIVRSLGLSLRGGESYNAHSAHGNRGNKKVLPQWAQSITDNLYAECQQELEELYRPSSGRWSL